MALTRRSLSTYGSVRAAAEARILEARVALHHQGVLQRDGLGGREVKGANRTTSMKTIATAWTARFPG